MPPRLRAMTVSSPRQTPGSQACARPPPRRNRRADMSPSAKLLAGVELGGTKCVCILGTGPEDVRAVERLPPGEREETLRQIDAVFVGWRSQYGAPRRSAL